jgi:hypothetical protein
MKKLLPKYFDSEWSFAQFRVAEGKSFCAFSEDGLHIITVTTEGTYYKAELPKKQGDCILTETKVI